jgi:hypothetical protein
LLRTPETGGILKEERQLWHFKVRLFAPMTQVFSVVVPMTQRFVFVPITQEKTNLVSKV